MDELRQLLLEKGRVAKVLEILKDSGFPGPGDGPDRLLIYGHTLCLYGDYQQALKVYAAVPAGTAFEPERSWGSALARLRLGDLEQAKKLLDEALAASAPEWLVPRIYHALLLYNVLRGKFDEAEQAIEKGIEAARRGSQMSEQIILEGNRGTIRLVQGSCEEAALILQKTVNQLVDRGCILSAASFLLNLCSALKALGALDEAVKDLKQAEGLIRESGSRDRLIFLLQIQGEIYYRQDLIENSALAYEEALNLLKEFPNPTLEAQIACGRSYDLFKRGSIGSALDLIDKTLAKVTEKGLHSVEDICLRCKGEILLLSGSTDEGMAFLQQALDLALRLQKWNTYCYAALYLSVGCEERDQKDLAVEWLSKCLKTADQYRLTTGLLDERDTLSGLLARLGPDLPASAFVTRLVIQLRQPALLKRMNSTREGKVLFLRALSVGDVRHFRDQVARLSEDPDKEVRSTSRLVLAGWQKHARYRVYTFGPFRVFLEGEMLSHRDWILPGVKRLFLFFATQPDEWHTTDSLLETLWQNPHPKKTLKVLNNLFSYLRSVFEPWRRRGGDYAFFQSRHGAYAFFPGERFRIDSQTFLAAAQRGEKAGRSGNSKEARKAFRAALDLYLGDYLKEFPYEDWLNQRRDYMREVYFRSVLRYAVLEQDAGNFSETRRVLEDALFNDPSRSGCAALLIQVLVRMKLYHEAKEWGQRHVAYLKKLKEKPAPEVLEALAKLGPE